MKDKLKSLEINKEETEAIRKYCDLAWFTDINRLLRSNIDYESKRNARDKRYSMPQYMLEMVLDAIPIIYSAMYKTSKKEKAEKRVYRGTSKGMLEYLEGGQQNIGFISTSDNIRSASIFSDVKHGAAMSIKVEKNVPFVNINEILGERYDHFHENEILVSPFVHMDGFEKSIQYKDPDGNFIDVYSTKVTKRQLNGISKKQQNNYRQRIQSTYILLDSLISFYANTNSEIEYLNEELGKKGIDEQRKKELSDRLKDRQNRLQELKSEYESIKATMRLYFEGVCKDVEKGIDQKYDREIDSKKSIQLEEKRKQKQEESRQKKEAEEKRMELTIEANGKKETLKISADKALLQIEGLYEELLGKNDSAMQIARKIRSSM